MEERILSIAVPSYRRFAELNQEIGRWIDMNLLNYCRILVVNDSDANNIIRRNYLDIAKGGIKVVNHGANLGYCRAFMSLIQNCETEYLLVIADDDILEVENIPKVISELARLSPDILATEWRHLDGGPMKGLSNRRIGVNEIRHAMSHAPGIVYDTCAANSYLQELSLHHSRGCIATRFYPQVIMGYLMSIGGASVFSTSQISGGYPTDGPRASDLKDSMDQGYENPLTQLSILHGFVEILSSSEGNLLNPKIRSSVKTEIEKLSAEATYVFHKIFNNWPSAKVGLLGASLGKCLTNPIMSIAGVTKAIVRRFS